MSLFGFTFSWYFLAGFASLFTVGLAVFSALFFRRVVSTNEVHIVQSSKKTVSYGKDTGNGNTYYEWPSWLPAFGIIKAVMPVSVFDVTLSNYEAYDLGRLPFVVDVVAFFRITDSNIAAQRVASFEELLEQLKAILQGAVRTILASNDIETIMQGRSTFGEAFTKEVESQLAQWGVGTVKNIELMDIRDHKDSQVIRNIMEKKKSHIEMESRQEVAKNHKQAEIAEIDAKQFVELQKQTAAQAVGLRTIEAQRQVSLANQEMTQALKEQEKTTKEKEMAVLKIQEVRKADIEKEVNVVKALQSKETTTIMAEGQLEAAKRQAESITLQGEAKANAEKAMQLAPVEAQIVLAKEIGGNAEYQKYLVTIRQVEAAQAVGVESAKALNNADIKVISNTGDAPSGLNKVMDLFSSTGGLKVGALLEGLSQTEAGKKLLDKVTGEDSEVA
jgi:flotillin